MRLRQPNRDGTGGSELPPTSTLHNAHYRRFMEVVRGVRSDAFCPRSVKLMRGSGLVMHGSVRLMLSL
jgi:hypothetical protein